MRTSNLLCLAFITVSMQYAGAIRKKIEIAMPDQTTEIDTTSTLVTTTTSTIAVFSRILHSSGTTESAAKLPGRHVLSMTGSPQTHLNGRWYERRDPEYLVDSVVTYWKEDGDSFMYFCQKSKFWAAVNGKYFRGYKEGGTKTTCKAVAHSKSIMTSRANPSKIVITETSPGMGWSVFKDGEWIQNESMGVEEVYPTCGSHSEESECKSSEGCQWNALGGICSIAWATFLDTPKYTDVSQGALGTCYLLAVFASVARFHPQVIKDAILTDALKTGSSATTQNDRIYQTQWVVAGKTIKVAVDDWVPVTLAGMPVFVGAGFQKRSKKGARVSGVVWPIILEKAWAKIHGNFKAVEAGRAAESFHALTGAPVDMFYHTDFEPDKLWEQIKSSADARFPMYAATGEKNTIGVAAGHAYGIIGAGITNNGTRYVRLYNPWSYHKYTGRLASEGDDNIGDFILDIDEFKVAYTHTAIAKIRAGYTRKTKDLNKINGRLSTTFKMKVASNNPFAVMLDWPSNRLLKRGHCDPLNLTVSIEVVSPLGKRFTAEGSFAEGGFHADIEEGVSGVYTVQIFAQFRTTTWIDNVVVTAYTDDSVDFYGDDNTDDMKVITLADFSKEDLNGDYLISSEKFDGFETYRSKNYVLYYCNKTATWNLLDAKTWPTIDKDNCRCFAYGSKSKDILAPTPLYRWKELVANEWKETPSAHSTRSRPATSNDVPKIVTLAGFDRTALVGDYVRNAEKFNGFETYQKAQEILYYCAKLYSWCVVDRETWLEMAEGSCKARAIATANKGIISSASPLHGWQEFVDNKWRTTPSAYSTWLPPNAGSLLQEYIDEGEIGDMPAADTCYTNVKHLLESFDNGDDILKARDDPLFPRMLSSIASPGATCGDTAQNISESCEIYNVWRPLLGPMSDEVP